MKNSRSSPNLVEELIRDKPAEWLDILQHNFGILATHDANRALVSLKYDQINSPMDQLIVRQCRGMVVDRATNTVLARPYDKFWNLGESRADALDWSSAVVQEKLDGSLIIVYWDPHSAVWALATSGHPTAGGSYGAAREHTFATTVTNVWGRLGMIAPETRHRDTCFLFEFCAPDNRIVVRYPEARLVLHGARRLDGSEWTREECATLARDLHWEHVKAYPISSAEEALAAAALLNAVESEGFVVVDARQNRVKVKSARYVALHHMRGASTPRRAIELWQAGEWEEVLAHFPELSSIISPILEGLDQIAQITAAAVRALSRVEGLTQKQFALAVKDEPWNSVAFRLRREGGSSAAEVQRIMRSMNSTGLEELLRRCKGIAAPLVSAEISASSFLERLQSEDRQQRPGQLNPVTCVDLMAERP